MTKKRGKKIDVLSISEGAQRYQIELRFDRDKGDFFAELGGDEFSSPTLAALKESLQTRAKEMVAYEYKWWIIVDFSIDIGSMSRFGFSSTSVDFDKLHDDQSVCGLNFRFRVVERSQIVTSKAKTRWDDETTMFMERSVEEVNGELQAVGTHESQQSYRWRKDDTFEFTPERYAKLAAIRAGLRELARRLNVVVGGDGDEVAKILDGLKSVPLQLAAESTVAAKGKKS